jgi:hypothetical protein
MNIYKLNARVPCHSGRGMMQREALRRNIPRDDRLEATTAFHLLRTLGGAHTGVSPLCEAIHVVPLGTAAAISQSARCQSCLPSVV